MSRHKIRAHIHYPDEQWMSPSPHTVLCKDEDGNERQVLSGDKAVGLLSKGHQITDMCIGGWDCMDSILARLAQAGPRAGCKIFLCDACLDAVSKRYCICRADLALQVIRYYTDE